MRIMRIIGTMTKAKTMIMMMMVTKMMMRMMIFRSQIALGLPQSKSVGRSVS